MLAHPRLKVNRTTLVNISTSALYFLCTNCSRSQTSFPVIKRCILRQDSFMRMQNKYVVMVNLRRVGAKIQLSGRVIMTAVGDT